MARILQTGQTAVPCCYEKREFHARYVTATPLIPDTESIYKKVFSDIAQRHGKVYTAEMRGKVIGTTEDVGARIAVEEMQLPMSPEDFLKEYKAAADKSLHTVGLMPGRHLHVCHNSRYFRNIRCNYCRSGAPRPALPHEADSYRRGNVFRPRHL